MSSTSPDPTADPGHPPIAIPRQILLAMAQTLRRPDADAPADTWQDMVDAAMTQLGALGPRDPIEAMLAVQVIAANAGVLDAYRTAMEPGTLMAPAARQRASAVAMTRSVFGLLRLLAQRQKSAPAATRDWGEAAAGIGALWRQAPVRPAEAPPCGRTAKEEPAEIIRWYDEIDDEELAIEDERVRRELAGEPPLPPPPGPKRIYKYKPGDYGATWKGADPKSFAHYPGWENMTMAERRAFFGYTYKGPGCPISMLSAESQAAYAAQQEVEAAERKEYGQGEATPER
jgi:hypothetical protein